MKGSMEKIVSNQLTGALLQIILVKTKENAN